MHVGQYTLSVWELVGFIVYFLLGFTTYHVGAPGPTKDSHGAPPIKVLHSALCHAWRSHGDMVKGWWLCWLKVLGCRAGT